MSKKQFISNLSSVLADIRKLDAKKIFLDNKDILEYIEESTPTPTVKHSQDTRETVTENDLWGQYIETKDDGTIIVHDDWVTNPNAANSKAWDTSITKVEDNKAYTGESGDTLFANIQFEKIKDSTAMFYNCPQLTSFASDLHNLTDGHSMFSWSNNFTSFISDLPSLTSGVSMFYQCPNLVSFASDSKGTPVNLSNLTNGYLMFNLCKKITTFTSDLPSLMNGGYMFNGCSKLIEFTSDLPSLTYGEYMFSVTKFPTFHSNLSSLVCGIRMFLSCDNFTSFRGDLSNLINGSLMFNFCSKLTSFTSDLSSLVDGDNMFRQCKLDEKSVMYIADTINDIAAEKQLYIDGTIPYVTLSNGVYSAPRGFLSDGRYVYTYKKPDPYTTTIYASEVGKLTLGINVTNNADTIKQQLEDFAKEATFDSWEDLKQVFVNKGWTVTFLYGGTATEIILPEDE